MKKNTLILSITSFIALLLITTLYLVGSWSMQPQQVVQYNQPIQGNIIPIPQDLSLYSCIELKSILGGVLKVCELKKGMGTLIGSNVVRGEYHSGTNTILLDKDSPPDRVMHEVFHSCSTQKIKEELKAQCFQNYYNQLLDRGEIK